MSPTTQSILIVGAADTGRAPIAAALLRRMAQARGYSWQIASAGVVGHDDDPLQPAARDALAVLGLVLEDHIARSLTNELAAAANVLIAVDSGIARVLRSRYPQATIASLGELAGRARDIPDPAGMQVGAWLQYSREMEQLLREGFARIVALLSGETAPAPPQPAAAPPAPPEPPAERQAICARAIRLLDAIQAMPDVIDWPAARGRIQTTLAELIPLAAAPTDLIALYVEAINLWLARQTTVPAADRLERLRAAIERAHQPVGQAEVAEVMRWVD
ncbi:phosphotyrosine protein phosphatase [Chloroflexus islandicus]|uniref:protein-tyrosine-phosphatase n=1 Tax=Chloroflexus islandicus TaxID=1707952 RepID=A0A178MDD4_9CHLR|nr:phosphotyrosine protein phosphatase [Chloroflexus islandicus]OAN46553.1 phosphotyrosine protein phosphatase [Chloroflexus islandicus]